MLMCQNVNMLTGDAAGVIPSQDLFSAFCEIVLIFDQRTQDDLRENVCRYQTLPVNTESYRAKSNFQFPVSKILTVDIDFFLSFVFLLCSSR